MYILRKIYSPNSHLCTLDYFDPSLFMMCIRARKNETDARCPLLEKIKINFEFLYILMYSQKSHLSRCDTNDRQSHLWVRIQRAPLFLNAIHAAHLPLS